MEYCVKHGPVFSVLEFNFNEAELVEAQPDSMLAMTPGIQLTAKMGRRGAGSAWWSGIKGMLGGESLFTAEFRAKRDSQFLSLAPAANGDIFEIKLKDAGGFYLTRGSYLANIGTCSMQIKYGGIKGMMSNTGLFLLHVAGEGTVFCQSYGAVINKTLSENEHFVVDNRYVVAFSDTIRYQLVKATSSMKDAFLSGEGLVNRFTGPGILIYQTRAKQTVGLVSRMFELAR